jgi:hypothetical protein
LVEGTEAIRGLLKLQQNSEVAAVVDVFMKLMALMFSCPSLMMEFFFFFFDWHRVSEASLRLIPGVHRPSARSFPQVHLG